MATIGKPVRKMSEIAVLQLDEPVRPTAAMLPTGAPTPVQVVPPPAAQVPPVVVVVVQQPTPSEAQLIISLRRLLADSYTMYLTAHAAHWNIEGCVFPSWHAFFGALYEDVFSAIDPFAEGIRQHGAYAPTSFAETLNAATGLPPMFQDGAKDEMVQALIVANTTVMSTLKDVRQAADTVGDEGLANFCQERMAAHLKHDWQLKAMGKL